jgi:hypothetical protein
MLHGFGREVGRADVVAVDEGGALDGAMELLEKLMGPGGLGHAVGHNAVLGLSAGAGDNELLLRGPGTRHNWMWAYACRCSQPSQRRCRPRAPTLVKVEGEQRRKGFFPSLTCGSSTQ